DLEPGDAAVRDFPVDQLLGDDADDFATGRQRGIGHDAHQADVAAAVDHGQALARDPRAELGGTLGVLRPRAGVRAAVDADRTQLAHSVRLVDGPLVNRHRGVVHRFGQRRVRVADAGEVVGGALELHRQHALVDQFGHVGADQVQAQHAVGLGVREHLHEAGRLGHRHRAADRREREAAGLVGNAFGLELLLGLADPGDLRLGVDDPRDRVEVDVARQAGDQLGHGDAFLEALVRQHRAAHAVADRPDTVHAGVAVLVHLDLAAVGELHPGPVGEQAPGRRAAAHGHQQLVDHDLLRLALGVGVGDVHAVLLHFGAGDLAAQADVQALLLELARGDLRHL